MKKGKIWMASLLALSMALTACSGGGESTSAAGTTAAPAAATASAGEETPAGAPAGAVTSSKDTLVFAMNSDPGTMNPWSGPMGPQLVLSCQSLEALTTYDESGELIPWLAESWEYDDDKMGCTFHLRQDVTFSNGNPFNADAVIYTMQTASAESASAKGYLANVDVANVKKVDEFTVHIPTLIEFGTLPYTMSNIFIVDPAVYEAEAARGEGITGTGPFVATDWQAGVSVGFTANETYWGGAPYIKNLEFRIITESSVRMVELENGAVDVNKSAATEDVNRVVNGETENISIWKADVSQAIYYFGINLSSEKMQDAKVRQAIMNAVDSETLCLISFDVAGSPSTSILPSNMWYSATLEGDSAYHYDPEGAKALLAEAGFPDGITIRLVCDSNAYRRAMAEALPSMMEKAGITIEVEFMESAAFNTWRLESKGDDFDVFLTNMGQLNEPSSAMTAFLSKVNSPEGGGNGMFRYAGTDLSNTIDSLINAAVAETDESARAKIYVDLQETIASNYIAKGIADMFDLNLVASNLKGMVFRPNVDFSKAYFE